MATQQITAEEGMVVSSLQGQAWVVAPDGSRRQLQQGDKVEVGQVVVTAEGAALEIVRSDSTPLKIESGRELLVDRNLLGTAPADAGQAALTQLNSGPAAIERIIAQGSDLSQSLAPTQSGLSSAADASSAHSFVRLTLSLIHI